MGFQYAVASGTIAAVNKPLLRLEFYVSTSATKVGEPSLVTDNQTQPFVAEFSKAQLDAVIAAMDAIEQVCLQTDGVISCPSRRFFKTSFLSGGAHQPRCCGGSVQGLERG